MSGRSTSSVRLTILRLFSMRCSMMSLMLVTSCSSLRRPRWTCDLYVSMFMLVQVSVIMPGRSLYSMSLKCGRSTIAVTGMTIVTIRSYSLSAQCRSLKHDLSLSSWKSTILADSGISMPIRSRHLASRTSCSSSRSKLT